MKRRFFEKEVRKAQARFNDVFGQQEVCSVKARQAAIMSICWLDLLCEKVTAHTNSREVKEDIAEFVKTKDTINMFFDKYESADSEGIANDSVAQIRQEQRQVGSG